MMKSRSYAISWLMFLLLMMPTATKLMHHHHQEECCGHSHGLQVEAAHEECAICDFEFSLFVQSVSFQTPAPALPSDGYIVAAGFGHIEKQPAFIFCKRGPPAC